MLCPSGRTHMNLDILNTCRLTHRPMNTRSSSTRRDGGQVKDQVSNLLEEYICRCPALISITLILVSVNHAESREARSGLENGESIRIADYVSIVVIDNGCGDYICSGWEVNDGWCSCGGFTACWRETTSVAYSAVDRGRVVCNTIACFWLDISSLSEDRHTLRAVIFDIAEDFVARRIWVERSDSLMSY